MGAGSSFHDSSVTRSAVDSPSSIVSHSSGYHSNNTSLQGDKHTITSWPKLSYNNNKIMPKHPLLQRPSQIIGAISQQEHDKEEELERKNVKLMPALKTVFDGFEDARKFLLDISKRHKQFYAILNKLLHDNVNDVFAKFRDDEQRMVLANRLARINFVEALLEFYNFLYDDLRVEGITHAFVEEANEDEDPGFLLVLTIREILWNYSDGSPTFSEKISQTNLFNKLAYDLQMILEDDIHVETEEELFAYSSSVGILHNCARNPEIDKAKFRDLKLTEMLYPFLSSELVYQKMVTLLALGNIVTEDEVSKLVADVDVIDFLLKAIANAMEANDRKEHGFHLYELVDGLAALAQSDQNKTKIMSKNDLLQMIVKIIEAKVTFEILACVKLVWELAFIPANKAIIKKDEALMLLLESLRTDGDWDIKRAANSAWFVLVDKDERLHNDGDVTKSLKKGIGAPSIGGLTPDRGTSEKHIMFSYCWGDKETVLKIYQVLQSEGYSIWIDVKEMNKYANLLEGMARAVEESYIIIVCFSEKYKQSQNCRTEADYAYARQKKIVPLKMQRGYKPDGWLGALIGAKMFIEFSPQKPFQDQMNQLRAQIKKDDTEHQRIQPLPSPSQKPDPPQPDVVQVRDWKKEQIGAWMTEQKLEGSAFKQVKKMTGEQLQFLHSVMVKSPETFYRWLETKLELKTLDDLMKFDRAIQALGNSIHS